MSTKVTVKIDGQDITSDVKYPTLNANSRMFSKNDRAFFRVTDLDEQYFSPSNELEIYDDGNLVYGGVIIDKTEMTNGIQRIFEVEYRDWSEYLATVYIPDETFENKQIGFILNELSSDYLEDFSLITDDTTEISRIRFVNMTFLDVLELFEDEHNLQWFIQPDKTIYTFKKIFSE